MNWNKGIRQFHRWVAIIFTVTVVVTVVVLAAQGPEWVSYVPLLPLALLFFSGLYLLVRWYRTSRRSSSSSPAGARATWVRPLHRWSAVTFLVTVLVTFVALSLPDPIIWVSYIPLLPLAALLISGLTMFAQVSMAKRRNGRALAA
ncbi:heparan-alpha-glucosaminide N-acetyltransferase domain-containing protein [Nocardia altamirensis]|uniref:heparan-alpha-glucosaminide N-acetyltransferase domain-containing protein n=1 Tax=Nocardia altamirensis TaxID=472158 RepID=UPI00157CBC9F|nr:heparan-alpha-glucosaminide N-acetyltransferase domain-containing protein [Nocardia altamirensis]